MKTLSALVEREGFEVPPFALDHFQRQVREELHLEFFLERGRLILTPNFASLTTSEASPSELDEVRRRGFATDWGEQEEGVGCIAGHTRCGTGDVPGCPSIRRGGYWRAHRAEPPRSAGQRAGRATGP